MASNLHALATAGQSVWSDQISRSMLDSGDLVGRISVDAVTGVTSNPSIFHAAITGSDDYDSDLRELAAGGASAAEIVNELMTGDIQRACDVLRPIWKWSRGHDGHVSVEVDPELASRTEETVDEAHAWVRRIDRPNLLVKVPATKEGIPAIRRLIADGVSVNVTLIFSIARYREVMEAYLGGLEDLHAAGGDVSQVASVASFFVSRVDTEVDRRLEEMGTPEALELRGMAAVSNARVAYDEFLATFRGPRWEDLVAAGARLQRPLWASTSTKNPDYRETLYVDTLVAPHTVNTMPISTIDAYQRLGQAKPQVMGPVQFAKARRALADLARVGIDYDDVVAVLEAEGVEKFVSSWRALLADVERKISSS